MEIRFACEKDIPGMIALLKQVGDVHHRGRPDLFRAGAQKYNEADLLALLQDKTRPIFIAAEDGAVLGYGFCIHKITKGDPVLTDYATLYIDDLCVDENCRGKHVGTALYDHILAYARQMDFDSVTLNVWTCNESAMKFYEARGLKPQKIGMETLLR